MLFVYDSGEAVSLSLSFSLSIYIVHPRVGVVALVRINSVLSFLQSIFPLIIFVFHYQIQTLTSRCFNEMLLCP